MATKPKSKPWRYGDPAPKSWRDTADILKALRKPTPAPKPEKKDEK